MMACRNGIFVKYVRSSDRSWSQRLWIFREVRAFYLDALRRVYHRIDTVDCRYFVLSYLLPSMHLVFFIDVFVILMSDEIHGCDMLATI